MTIHHSCIIFFIFLLIFSTDGVASTVADGSEESSQGPTKAEIREEIKMEVTREREQEAVEDPLLKRQSEKADNPVLHEIMPDIFRLYGSARVRYRRTGEESLLGDGGTRVGTNATWQFVPNYWLLGRAEVGFKLFDRLDQIIDPGSQSNDESGQDIFLRLGYVGVELPAAFLTYGKSWSTYYQVASFTDRFQGTGASASGVYNAGTDGGPSGTGRADRVWQTRIQVDRFWQDGDESSPVTVNLQYQMPGENIPHGNGAEYQGGAGLSAVIDRGDNFKSGFAINYTAVDTSEGTKLSRPPGLDGDDLSLLLGLQWYGHKWYLATTFSWLDNHMATNDGIYFDAWGFEGYGHFQLSVHIWVVGGWNYLEPRRKTFEVNAYVLRYGIVGLRYTFKGFQRMLYANVRIDSSNMLSKDVEALGNVFTVGMRWDFDW